MDETVVASLRRLVEDGNRAVALARLGAMELSVDDRGDLVAKVRSWRVPMGRVLAPLVNTRDPPASVTAEVRLVEGGDWQEGLGPVARRSSLTALERAWHVVGGVGAMPRVVVRIPALDTLDWQVDGRSIFLPAFLAAVGHLGGMSPTANIVATGDWEEDLDRVSDKARLGLERRKELGCGPVLVAARGNPFLPEGLLACPNEEWSVKRVYVTVPWSSTAKVTRVHAFFGERWEPPGCFIGREFITVALGEAAKPEDLPAVASRVRKELTDQRRVELHLAGPVAVAAYLSCVTKNNPTDIRVVDTRDNRSWWSNRVRVPAGAVEGAPTRGEVRVVVGTPASVPAGWHVYAPRPDFVAERLVEDMAGLLAWCAGADHVHVAVCGPLAVAWAVAHVLQNQLPFAFHQWQDGQYQPWFTSRGGTLTVLPTN
jgi:hypothetical protein